MILELISYAISFVQIGFHSLGQAPIAEFAANLPLVDQDLQGLCSENYKTVKGQYDMTKQYEMNNSSHTVNIAEIRLS